MKKLKQAIIGLLVLGVGFIMGSWLGVERRAQEFSNAVERRLKDAPKGTPQPGEPAARSFEDDGEMISALMSALSEEDALFRAHRLHTLLGHLTSAELGGLFDRVLHIKDRDQREAILRPLLARWEVLDSVAAEAAMRPILERLRSGQRFVWGSNDDVVIKAWAQVRPDLALAMAMTAPDSSWSKWVSRFAMEASTEGDPAKQLELLKGMPANALRANLCEQALRELAKKDSAAAEAQLNLLTNPKQRRRLQVEIISSLAERDPAAALARVTELAGELGSGAQGIQLVSAVLSKAASKDPQAALAAVEGLPEELRHAASGGALIGWIEKSPSEALEWAKENGVDIADAKRLVSFGDFGGMGWNTAFSASFQKDREQTLAWIREQAPSPQRDAMLSDGLWSGNFEQRLAIYSELTPEGRVAQVGRVLSDINRGVDPSAAEAWVQSLPAGPERVAAVEGLVSLQLRSESGRADELIASYPPGPERDAATAGAVSNLRNTNQPKAMELAAQITDPATRETAYVNVARTWIYRDRTAALAWISTTQVINPELKRVLLRQAEER